MAVIVEKQSSEEVIRFIRERWAPVFGLPRTLLCDQGRAFVSHELEAFAGENTIHISHIAVQAPWQNGLCERTGGILKTLLAACSAAQSLMGYDEMVQGPSEALLAYNMDDGDNGCSPMQAAVGRQPLRPGDTLAQGRLGEIDAMMGESSFARLVAIRETARVAMLRLHFSKALRRGGPLSKPNRAGCPCDRRLSLLLETAKVQPEGQPEPT